MQLEKLPKTIVLRESEHAQLCAIIVDQRKLPQVLEYLSLVTHDQVIAAIKTLALRGAPAIGVAGAAALALYAANESTAKTGGELVFELEAIAQKVSEARPTAVNLSWAVNHALSVAKTLAAQGTAAEQIKEALCDETNAMIAEDEQTNRAIGAFGATLFEAGTMVLTHCNAGSLATAFYGTALGVIYTAAEQGKITHVFADETRPVGQGARLTAWELACVGIPCTLICDNMAASVLAQGEIDAIIVGADRIAANGDTANKIGTYGLAVLASYHNVPFYVAAPTSTIDPETPHGSDIPIEQRAASEVSAYETPGVDIYNPAFDVTPASLITAIVTECGIFKPSEIAAAMLRDDSSDQVIC
ncbi:MAG: S-methyl-5-thioribose-1-phosphate isomerase [Raoultibacter sp.]